MINTQNSKLNRYQSRWIGVALASTMILAGCVNDNSTSALTNTEIKAKQSTHEQRHVASKCNSGDRLGSSNVASQAINNKFTEYSQNEASLSPERKSAIVASLQSQGAQLEALDQNLNAQCIAWSTCEFQAFTTKQGCRNEKFKFIDAEKQMKKFVSQIAAIKTN